MDYAEVYIDIKTFDLSLPFDYIIPENLSSEIKTGTVVFVHFNNRKELGFVTRIKQTTGVDDRNLKFIYEIVSNFSIFDRTRLKLIFWMSTYFVQSVSKVINFFLPPGPENKIIKVLKNPDKFIKSSAKISGKNANLSESTLKENNVQAQFLKNIGSPGKEHLSEIKKCMQQHSFGGFLLKNINQSEKIFLIKDLCSAAISMGKKSLILSPETEDEIGRASCRERV